MPRLPREDGADPEQPTSNVTPAEYGAFPIDPKQPGIASLRYGLELLHTRKVLTIFPEGNLYPGPETQTLKRGLARLARKCITYFEEN